MKPKPDFETPFEDSLAEFELAPLPADWKAELIENALSGAAVKKNTHFPSFTKIAVGTLAACWVLIGLLHATTPSTDNVDEPNIAGKTELTPEVRMKLAAYIGGGSQFNSTHTP